jgi:hypothetical protein
VDADLTCRRPSGRLRLDAAREPGSDGEPSTRRQADARSNARVNLSAAGDGGENVDAVGEHAALKPAPRGCIAVESTLEA